MTHIQVTNHKYPLVVEVTMYRHNLIDNRILNEVRRNARLNRIDDNKQQFFVPTEDLKDILNSKFSDDIAFQAGLSTENLSKNVTSAFFLHSVTNLFTNLKFVKFNISKEKNYTRKNGESISFDYKILHAKINLPEIVQNKKELKAIQRLLLHIKFWKYNKWNPVPFIEISSRDLISQLHYYESSEPEFVPTFGETVNSLLQYIDMKLESDNSTIHLVVLD